MNKKNKKRINRALTTTLAGSLVVSNMPLNVFAELMTDEQDVSIATDLNEQEVVEQEEQEISEEEILEMEAQEEAIEDEEKEVSGNHEDENTEIEPEIELEQEEEIEEEQQSGELVLEEVDETEELIIEESEPQEVIVDAQVDRKKEVASADNPEPKKDEKSSERVSTMSSNKKVEAYLSINRYQPFFAITADLQKYDWLKVSENELKSRRISKNESTKVSSTFTLKETTTISIDYRASCGRYDYGYIYLNGREEVRFSWDNSGTYTKTLTPGTYTIELRYERGSNYANKDDAVYFSNFKGVDLDSFVADYQVEYDVNNEGWMPYEPIVDLPFEGGEVSVRECMDGSCNTVFTEKFSAVSKLDVNGYSGGDGSQSSPYLISTAEELGFLAYEVNSLQNNTSGKYYQLTNDIDLSGFDSDDDASNGNWTPIGGRIGDFEGVFDGQYYKISNLEIKDESGSYLALFGAIKGAEIKDLAVIDANIYALSAMATTVANASNSDIKNVYASGTVEGHKKYAAGGVVGGVIGSVSDGLVSNVHADVDVNAGYHIFVGGLIGAVQGSTIQDCSATGNVVGENLVGGLIGDSYYRTKIDRSYAEGDVLGADTVGGFIGDAEGTEIRDSYALGNVSGASYNPFIGGFIGELDLSTVVYRSYSVGEVPSGYYSGGFAGMVHQKTEDCYWDVETSGTTKDMGGSSGGGTVYGAGLKTAQMTGLAAIENMKGFDFDNVWSTTSSYPILKWQESSKPIVTNQEFTTYVGDEFNILDHIKIESPSGLDTVIKNVKNEVDINTVGTYTVTFSVIDSHWNQTEHSVKVHVIKKPAPVINVDDISINVGDVFNPLSIATVSDEIDKDIELQVIENTVDENTPGEYIVTYQAVNSLGEITTKSITVTVVGDTEETEDNNKPVDDDILNEDKTENDALEEKPESNKDDADETKPIIGEQNKEEESKVPVKVETGLATSGAYLVSGIFLTISGFISSRKRK